MPLRTKAEVFEGHRIQVTDGYMDGTALCLLHPEKRFNNWATNQRTIELMSEIELAAGIPAATLIRTGSGRAHSYVHPLLWPSLGQYCSRKCELWVNMLLVTRYMADFTRAAYGEPVPLDPESLRDQPDLPDLFADVPLRAPAPVPSRRRTSAHGFGAIGALVTKLTQRLADLPTDFGTMREEFAHYFVMLIESLRGKQQAPYDLRASLFRCYHEWPLGGRFDRFNGLEILDARGVALPGAGTLHHITGGFATARNFFIMSLDFNSQLETDADAAAQLDAVLPEWREWQREWIAAHPADRAIWERCVARARDRNRSLRKWRSNMFRKHHRLFCSEPNGCPNCDDSATA